MGPKRRLYHNFFCFWRWFTFETCSRTLSPSSIRCAVRFGVNFLENRNLFETIFVWNFGFKKIFESTFLPNSGSIRFLVVSWGFEIWYQNWNLDKWARRKKVVTFVKNRKNHECYNFFSALSNLAPDFAFISSTVVMASCVFLIRIATPFHFVYSWS